MDVRSEPETPRGEVYKDLRPLLFSIARGNFERLRRVKAQYDPDNLFRVNRNIPPAA
jgi:FAD/FMN-containing dehydrogenase